jgi:hypothetical protein
MTRPSQALRVAWRESVGCGGDPEISMKLLGLVIPPYSNVEETPWFCHCKSVFARKIAAVVAT